MGCDGKKPAIDTQTLADVEESWRLEANSIESASCAAIIYGEAARKDAKFQEKALHYLTEALRKGLPIEAANPYPFQLKRIIDLVDGNVLAGARHDAKYRLQFTPAHEPPSVAEWNAFQTRFGVKREQLVRNK